jgi:hypothetical protein
MFKHILFAVFAILLLATCKKEGDDIAPSIQVISPTDAVFMSLPDTLNVIAIIKDNVEVRSVKVSLVDDENVSVGPSFTNTFSSAEVNFNVAFIIEDLSLETGSYFLQITASDGENESKSFVPLSLVEVPKEMLGTFYSYQNGNLSALRYDLLNGDGGTLNLIESNAKHDVQHIRSRVFVSQYENRFLSAYEYGSSWSLLWESDLSMSSPGGMIESVEFDKHRDEVVVNTGADGIFLYRYNGTLNGMIPMESTEICRGLIIFDTEIWMGVSSLGGQNSLIQVYRDSGVRGTILPLNFTPGIMKDYSSTRVAMAIPNGDVAIKNIQTGEITPVDIPDDNPIIAMEVYNGEIFVLKTGQLFRVTAGFQVQGLFNGTDLRDFKIDRVQGRMMLVIGNTLRTFNIFPWISINEVGLNPEAMEISILYNK